MCEIKNESEERKTSVTIVRILEEKFGPTGETCGPFQEYLLHAKLQLSFMGEDRIIGEPDLTVTDKGFFCTEQRERTDHKKIETPEKYYLEVVEGEDWGFIKPVPRNNPLAYLHIEIRRFLIDKNKLPEDLRQSDPELAYSFTAYCGRGNKTLCQEERIVKRGEGPVEPFLPDENMPPPIVTW
ncbi:MAG: hypothetical protein K8S55_13905 [Phycisphaerae bacterium]|nr:hypothetical protein [Phycisphaerae bacterium]